MIPDSSVSIDDSRWPLRMVRFVGTATLQQYEDYLAETSACLRRRERYVSIIDLSRGGMPPTQQRQRQVAWLQEHEPLVREVLLGVAFVITSPLVRLAVSTILHFKPVPVPYIMTSREQEAAAWASARIEEQGLHHAAECVRRHFGLPASGYAGRNKARSA